MRRCLLVLLLVAVPPLFGQSDPISRAWNAPVEPFRIVGNLYYVGAADIASYLIATSKGHILIDGGFVETVPHIRANLEKLGFDIHDVKILLNTHAHYDHAGGLAALQKLTGALVMASEADTRHLEAGGVIDPQFGDRFSFPPVKVDRRLLDGDRITVGASMITARLTPGHTPGATTWVARIRWAGRSYDVVIVSSVSVPSGYQLTNNAKYPNVIEDYRRSFRLLRSLPCDIFLGPHGSFFDLTRKRKLLGKKPAENPFVDPAGWKRYLDASERRFEDVVLTQSRSDRPR
ncbi:MAG TPA: subclass B3 metallo-beta-lactamase [Thermoanaerobaculia bacterium]|nr:subclass B3 metallo-beta-lactamase [Thermoanaerobaculia bacterium]